MSSHKITVFGSGYVGLVTGACFAEVGNEVLCVDVDADRVERLNKGEIPIFEPGLEQMIRHNLAEGRISFTTDAARGIDHGLFLFIAVGTPSRSDGAADLQYVDEVARTIGRHMREHRIVCTKSTVPVGTADRIEAIIDRELRARGIDAAFDVVSNPEFLKEGSAVQDFMKPNRVIIGTESDRAIEAFRGLYSVFMRNHERILTMDARSAELTKYAANAMLATRISFMNEIANLAEKMGANVEHVRIGIGSDPRIGFQFLYPGCGYGGSCFPKDVRALIRAASDHCFEPELLTAVNAINERQKRRLFEKIGSHFRGELFGRRFALWGLAFKPNTDDMREAPSRVVMEALWEAGAIVQAFDPIAVSEAGRIYGRRDDLVLCSDKESALDGADALVVLTEWMDFRSPNLDQIRARLRAPVIFDGRNLYDPVEMSSQGFTYYGIGIGAAQS